MTEPSPDRRRHDERMAPTRDAVTSREAGPPEEPPADPAAAPVDMDAIREALAAAERKANASRDMFY